MRILSCFLLIAVATSLPLHAAEAWEFDGNPTVNLTVDRSTADLLGADVRLTKVRVHQCSGGYTDYPVDQDVDLVQGHSLTVDGGDLCGVSAMWANDMVIDHAEWSASYDNLHTSVQLTEPDSGSTPLLNLESLTGTFSGATPTLYVNIN